MEQLANTDEVMGIGWESVRIGAGLRSHVVSLEAFRRRRDAAQR